MELEAERISPTLTSRYMTNYIPSPTTDIYHQNYHSPRQNMHSSFYPMMENDRNYLKRHYYMKEEGDNEERERKFEKLMDHGTHYSHPYHTNEQIYDSYNNNTLYPDSVQDDRTTTTTTESSNNNVTLINTNNSNDNYPNNSSPATSTEDASDRIADSPKSIVSVKKTKGRVKIKMEYISNKLRRYTTFSKRKTGIMKKAYELSTLTGTQVMLLVASETGHVYTFATRKLQPMITSEAGKQLIQTCLNSPEAPDPANSNPIPSAIGSEQRMSASGFEETELTFDVDLNDASEKQKVRQPLAYHNPSVSSAHLSSISQTLPSSHSHLYTLPHPSQHYVNAPQTHYSPHYSPPSPSLAASQHFQPPASNQYPSYYENNGNNTTVPLSSYQSIRTPVTTTPSIPISPPVNNSTEATR